MPTLVLAVNASIATPVQFASRRMNAWNQTDTDLSTQRGQEISIFQGVEMLHLCSLATGSAGVGGGGGGLNLR